MFILLCSLTDSLQLLWISVSSIKSKGLDKIVTEVYFLALRLLHNVSRIPLLFAVNWSAVRLIPTSSSPGTVTHLPVCAVKILNWMILSWLPKSKLIHH